MSHCRSKAYRDFWDFAYHIARAESFNDKSGQKNSVIYIAKYMLKAVNTNGRADAVNLGDAIKMVEKAIELIHPESSEKPLTQSELRRFELEQKTCIAEKVRIHNAFIDLMCKSKHATSPRDMWKLFYRAQRVYKSMLHHDSWLFDFDSINDQIRHEYTPKMKECASNIFYPRLKASPSALRRNELRFYASDYYIATQAELALTPFDEDCPF